MFSLFEFAIGVRLLVFIVFVDCVYGGNGLFVHLGHRKKIPLEDYLCDSLLDLSPHRNLCRLVCILLWIKCLDALLMLGHFCLGAKKIPMCQLL